ncbi:HD domain-containing phosphohydrolase [Aeromonas taiwanensis]|uniref:HD domain-containing phosphohydrolase n=1 Tax=Aeromonas taiwanensis TaxID=633417 RepID=UPI00207D2E7D|nr:HD domain-containing phosphohydrolase [Aeromonas taiwanensis]MCO4204251.1 HD domain-containing protein [Aeromonas taiwanensis]
MTSTQLSRKPFYVHIATLFILLFSVLGGALILLQFQQGMQQGLAHERQSFQHYREQLALAITLNQRPARMSLSLLRSGQLSAMPDLEARLAFLPQLAEVLANSSSYGAIYVGYDNGDFFLVRKLTERAKGALDNPPAESRLLVQSLSQGRGEFLYFDQRQRLLERRPMPEYRFDPRDRGWYKQARWNTGIIVTHPYLFFTTREPGMTLAVESDDRRAVIGLDAGVEGLSSLIGELPLPSHSQLVLFDEAGTLLATDPKQLPSFDQLSRLPMLTALRHPVLALLQQEMASQPTLLHNPSELTLSTDKGEDWLINLSSLGEGSPFYLALLVPAKVLTAPARQDALHNLAWAFAGLLLLLPVIWLVARRTATPLLALTAEAERIQQFDFGQSKEPGSAIREIDDLARAMSSMRLTLGNFMSMGRALTAEHRFDSLLSRILHETVSAAQAEGGALYLAQKKQIQAVQAIWQGQPLPCEQVIWQDTLLAGLYHTERLSLRLDEEQWNRCLVGWGPFPGPCQLLVEPLHNHRQELIGSLLLVLPDCSPRELVSRISLIEALAGMSASAIENQRLLEEQKQLLEAFIELIAGAIDAKSPYTGGHCQRVPELTKMLTEAACAQQQGPFRDFSLNDEEWEAIHIASWLHDCGKVTTPEFVVDKATKLETIYDRIHEIRTRFEVLKRDAHIEALAARLPASERQAAEEALASHWQTLDEEFAFVAECNLGGEWMAPEKLARLDAIAKRSWMRTLDDRLGISQEERKRHPGPSPLPCREQLLADKPVHLIPRPDQDNLARNNPWGFKVRVPTHLYNRGEHYNLAIGRGTLTEEERYKINEHIIQTIRMLERLPFPRHLSKVPEIAGGHHERMDGTGYPRQLQGGQMSIPARIMAIADIFEALTASDRPYKSGKTVSQSLGIMQKMVEEQHIDPTLFALFIESGVWRDYARRFLAPEQLDETACQSLLAEAH